MKKLLLMIGILISIPSYASVSANVAFASDYIWRGMTQSDGPAISGGFDYAADNGFYAGIWGSNVNFNDGAGSELDYYFGYGFEVAGVGVDLGYVAFDYPENNTGLDFEEIVLGLSMGGFGVWDALQRRPHFFAAGVPICGGGDVSKSKIISHIPIWAWHGDKDDVIHVNRSRDMYQNIKKYNSNIKYSEIKNRGHDVWLDAWDSKELWDWIYRQNR